MDGLHPLHHAAIELTMHGCTVIPVRADGSKAPALRGWQNRGPATPTDLHTWFGGDHPQYGALGIVCGPASGGLELTEIEGAHIDALTLLDETARADDEPLWELLNTGWVERSPSGGIHWIYRVQGEDTVAGNTKLANAADRTVIAETRGTGGQFVAAPTPGTAHTTGRPWERLTGGPATIPTLTAQQRDQFHAWCRTLDQTPAPTPQPVRPAAPTLHTDGTSPGDAFEAEPWEAILEPHGWTKAGTRGTETLWVRPGKTPDQGISATTGYADDRDRLFVFSTSTDFQPETPYTKLGAFAVLNAGGDHHKAAQMLRNGQHTPDGRRYGTEPSIPADQLQARQDAWIRAQQPAPAVQEQGTGTHGAPTPAHHVPHQKTTGTHLATVTPIRDDVAHPHTITLRSDDGNAATLAHRYGDRLRYCPDRGRWLHWNGHTWDWQPAGGGLAREYAKEIGRAMPDDQEWVNHKRRTLSAKGTTDLLTQAATDPRLTVRADQLDAHPWELNTPAGILNLRTGILGPSDPAKLHTRTTRWAPDFNADTTRWDAFLDQTFKDPDLIDYMHRLIGYSAVGVVREHVLPFAHGSGGNGKGVFLEALMKVLGDYATTSPNGFLMATSYAAHSTEIARLAGARMVLCSEVNEDDRFDEAKVKLLTGGDTLTARFMRQDDFTFTPTHQLWLMGNHKPGVTSGGRSFWRRLRLVPFEHEVPEHARIDGLQDLFADHEHGPALLAWIATGAAAYHQHGLTAPATVSAATAQYAQDVDTVGRFLAEDTELHPHNAARIEFATPAAKLRAAYESWCMHNGETPIRGRAFTSQLSRHGILTGADAPRDKHAKYYGGVTLLHEHTDPFDGDRGGW